MCHHFFALMAKKHEAGRLRFMSHQRRFIISMIASYGEAVLHFQIVSKKNDAIFRGIGPV